MVSRTTRRLRQDARKYAEKRYKRHRRHNLLYAEPGPHEFVIILDNLKPSFNIGKIFRSADAFGARAVHLIGIDYFDVKAAKGSFKWVPAHFHSSFADCHQTLAAAGYTFFILEPAAKQDLGDIHLPRRSAFIFGHEEFGISFEPTDYQGLKTTAIPQYGRVESLNVSVAASVVMYEYLRRHPR